jgi:cellulose synthase/poly-beta-1,6-N-acetylglucosamine synthase-like glycosyltransferase
MAFRRDAYDDVGGYRGIRASVTEDYALFQAIGQHPDWTAQLVADPTIENDTEAVETIVDMFRQRRRWARGALSASPLAFVFYAIILAAHALPLFIAPLYPAEAGAMIAAKILTDAAVLAVAGQPWPGARPADRWGWFIPFQAWLYAYVLALPLSLAVVPDIRWKGRDFASQASRTSGASGS